MTNIVKFQPAYQITCRLAELDELMAPLAPTTELMRTIGWVHRHRITDGNDDDNHFSAPVMEVDLNARLLPSLPMGPPWDPPGRDRAVQAKKVVDLIDTYMTTPEYSKAIEHARQLAIPATVETIRREIECLLVAFHSSSWASEMFPLQLLGRLQSVNPPFSIQAIVEGIMKCRDLRTEKMPSEGMIIGSVKDTEREFQDKIAPLINLKARRQQYVDVMVKAEEEHRSYLASAKYKIDQEARQRWLLKQEEERKKHRASTLVPRSGLDRFLEDAQ